MDRLAFEPAMFGGVMAKVVEKKSLGESVFWMKVAAPEIALKRKPGQFVVLKIDEEGERFPLTICDGDPAAGTLTLVFQVVGASTAQLAMIEPGGEIMDLAGPLGKPTHIEKFGTVACIGGGIGIAPIHPIAQGMRAGGNHVISILGARTKGLLILEDMMKLASDEQLVCTDDGSYCLKGFTSTVLENLINDGRKIDLVVAIGPVPMMKVVANLTKKHGLKTVVSLNPVMVDGTGMCGCCRVTVGGKTKFACVDGPEFDGHEVDFDELTKRLRTYVAQEKTAVDISKRDHKACWER